MTVTFFARSRLPRANPRLTVISTQTRAAGPRRAPEGYNRVVSPTGSGHRRYVSSSHSGSRDATGRQATREKTPSEAHSVRLREVLSRLGASVARPAARAASPSLAGH